MRRTFLCRLLGPVRSQFFRDPGIPSSSPRLQLPNSSLATVLFNPVQCETLSSDLGIRFYRGGGRSRGRSFQDFEREYGQPGEQRGPQGYTGRGRGNFDFDKKDDSGGYFGGGTGGGGVGGGSGGGSGGFSKMDFAGEDEERPKTAEARMLDLKRKERILLLRKFKTIVVAVNRTFKVTKGGGEINFTALVICGNGDGVAGYAKGKGPKAPRAIKEASTKALNNLYYFERFKGQTIYHYVEAKYEQTKVRLWPEWTLGVFRAGNIVRGILRLAGIKSIKSKLIGSAHPHNTVKATFMALSKEKKKNRMYHISPKFSGSSGSRTILEPYTRYHTSRVTLLEANICFLLVLKTQELYQQQFFLWKEELQGVRSYRND